MIDKEKLQEVLEAYKRDFPYIWEDTYEGIKCGGEKYKWEAVKKFQEVFPKDLQNFDGDFADMLERALKPTGNILDSGHVYSRDRILMFAKADAKRVQNMFVSLYDEGTDLIERIKGFKEESDQMMALYGGNYKSHYQNEHAIMVYLWLQYPDKYFIYRYGEARTMAEFLRSDCVIKKIYSGSNDNDLENYVDLYDEVCKCIAEDDELISLVKQHLTDECYPDPYYRTLTFDVSFYLKHFYADKMTAKEFYTWFPNNYSPKISVDKWVELLQNPDVFTEKAKTIMTRIKAHDGQATCTQLSEEYGEEVNFYNSGSVALARRVAEATGCEPYKKASGDIKWWPILYVGKPADKDEAGTYIWKLRKELAKAMDQVDLTVSNDTRYWWLNASPRIWSFSNIEVGKTQSYTMYNENGNKRHVFQNFLDAQIGDKVIGYESNPMKKIVALCEVSAKDDETIQFKKLENLVSPIDYSTLKETPELEEMEFFQNPNGTLFALTADEYGVIMDAIREENPLPEKKSYEKYDREKFLDEVFVGSDLSDPSDPDAAAKRYDDLAGLVNDKWNVILTGAPGVGKTFAAKRLAYSLMGEENDDRIEMVQFHQNYSYEDFVLGYKPNKNGGFNLKDGVFYRFCQKASNDRENKYFFIIDEINRGNMSRIFGELLMMIEKDYRGKEMRLAYEDRALIVPSNIRIIGMMNTADRSLAMIDYALRRRFSFFEMEPAFNSEGFKKYQRETVNDATFDKLIDKIVELNKEIEKDSTLGKGFCIGHSYFSEWKMKDYPDEKTLLNKMRRVVKYDIIPMLEEYWFDEPNKVREEENKLLRVVKLPEVPES